MATRQLVPLLHFLRRVAVPASVNDLADGPLLVRFAAGRDEAAFEALVRRHGPMVLGVCRRLLHDWHAAEDAFQATFLVLARKAASLTRPERLAAFLHGVALRTASRARVEAARRRAHESRAPAPAPTLPADALDWQDLRPVLDAEINRLPLRYRTPFVLCYLEGRTNAEAAQQLGCSRGTVATLLARARERLRHRLLRRGVAPSVGLLTLSLTAPTQALPVVLKSATVRMAASFAAGAISAPAASLAQGVMKAMLMTRLKLIAVVLLAVSFVGGGVGVATYRAASPAHAKPGPRPVAPPLEPEVPAVVTPLPAVPQAPEDGNTALYRSDNFMVTAPSAKIAKRIAEAAEHQRKTQAVRWLGREMPRWKEPCPLRVRITSTGTGGATSFQFDNGKVLGQEMHIEGSLESILTSVLPHEVTHTVMAYHFKKPVPRWADEGASVLSESDAEQLRHEKVMRQIVDQGRRIPLRRLVSMRDYPRDVMVLFAQGHSLSRFLVQAAGRKTFLDFVADGMKGDWDAALKKHYSYRTVEELEAGWLASVARQRLTKEGATARPKAGTATVSQDEKATGLNKPRGSLPTGPAPIQVLAALDRKGSLIVYRSAITTYELRSDFQEGKTSYFYAPVQGMKPTLHSLETIRVFDTDGRKIDLKKLSEILKGTAPALASVDGKPVDPLHLRLVKEGTLIFVLPVDPRPAPPAVAPGVDFIAPPTVSQ